METMTPKNVFRKFKEVFKTSGLFAENWENNKLWTKKMIGNGKTREKGDYGIFGKIAENFGFYPEERRKDKKTDFHVERGWLTSDQLWSIVKKKQIWELEAAIEHENSPSWDKVCYALAKLADIKVKLKILVGYPNHEKEWRKLLNQISKVLREKPLKNKEEKYLIIFGREESNKIEFEAWMFNYLGVRIDIGRFVR